MPQRPMEKKPSTFQYRRNFDPFLPFSPDTSYSNDAFLGHVSARAYRTNLAVLTSSNVGLDVSSAGEGALGLRGFADSHQADLWLQGCPGSTLVREIDPFLIGWRTVPPGGQASLHLHCLRGRGGWSQRCSL